MELGNDVAQTHPLAVHVTVMVVSVSDVINNIADSVSIGPKSIDELDLFVHKNSALRYFPEIKHLEDKFLIIDTMGLIDWGSILWRTE